MTNGARQVAMH
jgi:hypothetical protein